MLRAVPSPDARRALQRGTVIVGLCRHSISDETVQNVQYGSNS